MANKIAIIPARAGSKGLQNKNILMLVDKPLIAYTIEAALKSNCFEKVIVSTDSLEYKDIAERYGAEVLLRSEELASDTATSYMVIEDVLKYYKLCSYFALLQPTSPFRTARHIQEAVSLFESSSDINFLVSVSESSKNSDLIKPLDTSQKLSNFNLNYSNYRRQNSREYAPNGAIFIGKVNEYLHKKHFFGADSIAYIMNKADSIDIDDSLDFEFAIALVMKNRKQRLLNESIKKRISEKLLRQHYPKPVTLIGHSIFDFWELPEINGREVNNFGIAGINSEQYYKLILSKNIISKIGDKVFLYFGTNDIVLDGWDVEYTIYWVGKIIEKIKMLNPKATIYLLEVSPVIGRIERSNAVIKKLNKALSKSIEGKDNVNWVPLSKKFYDGFGNLSLSYTYDGLHFNEKAYKQLEHDLMELIK
ncbi:acylneuraminate cytidylyltransferase [Citrobacter amalonaticus]|uniref:cytidylyltransferase domain-containing protein n=1 Tax=Citrobacter amalonaticus TaxID=35703 RepID=UPI0017880838|nr:GDSL-type esterase/lipase family protein [Citrobacter amalonaticus]MBE0395235.1 acylneuraminate cytidylyltransferase [Citrobacter amalonaticus]